MAKCFLEIIQKLTWKKLSFTLCAFILCGVVLLWNKQVFKNTKSTCEQFTFPNNSCPFAVDLNQPFLPNSLENFRGNIIRQTDICKSKESLNHDHIVILTPINNVEHYLDHYFTALCSLTYPHHLISVVLGQDSSTDNTTQKAFEWVNKLKPFFRKITVHNFKEMQSPIDHKDRHERKLQEIRRAHMAKSRNKLFQLGLDDEEWVLWLDADLVYYPPDIIQTLMGANVDLVVPACLFVDKDTGEKGTYDRNSWRETGESLAYQKNKNESFVMFEGYGASLRKFLYDIKDEGAIVKLDGVGGCVLLIKARCHRKGLVFPKAAYRHHLETEGLAKMATDMGFLVMGMPFVEVFHMN